MFRTAIDGDVIVWRRDAVADNTSQDKVDMLHIVGDGGAIGDGKSKVVDLIAQAYYLKFEKRITFLKVFVDVAQIEVRCNAARTIVDRSRDGIGRCEVDVLLIRIVMEQQVAAYKHIENEYKPMTMLYEKIKQLFHLSDD